MRSGTEIQRVARPGPAWKGMLAAVVVVLAAAVLVVVAFAAIDKWLGPRCSPRVVVVEEPPRDVAAPAPGARAAYVVIVSVDGLRPDAIDRAEAPMLRALRRWGACAAQARTVDVSYTLPSHVSMLTGLDVGRHGVTWNEYRPGAVEHETAFSIAHRAGRSTAMFFAKSRFHYLIRPGSVDFVYGKAPNGGGGEDTSADGLAKAFADAWRRRGFALTFLHIGEVDGAGHKHGWMGPQYLAAVAVADRALGTVWGAIETSGREAVTALLVTADHGGNGKDHGDVSPETLSIPWICVAPGVRPGLRIERPVRIVDTCPTALALLGIPPPEGLDGKTVEEVVATEAKKNAGDR